MSGPAWFLRLRDTAPNWTERYVAVETALTEGLLDGATLAEYLAAATTAARAEAVLDALSDPVTVRVYNGDGTIMGQGTMQTPWATTAAGVITLAEVTQFVVTQSGTPDPASWYLRFESGTRWVRGSFGLADSLAACTWSLPTWQAGQNGTIGTITIGVPSGSAPSLVGAPSALEFTEEVGGSYDFSVHGTDPDGGLLTYSISPSNITGVSMSSAGVLSVSSVAAAAVRTYSVIVTDSGGLSSSWPVSVTITAVAGYVPSNATLAALGYISVTTSPYNADPTGVADSTAAIQAAIDAAYSSYKSVWFPSGTYKISSALRCYRWQAASGGSPPPQTHQLYGASYPSRPVIKLTSSSVAGFTSAAAPRAMLVFAQWRPTSGTISPPTDLTSWNPLSSLPPGGPWTSNTPNLFYETLSSIDFDTNGNAGAVGLVMATAQNSYLGDCKVTATGSYAGIMGLPGRDSPSRNIEVIGGSIGISTDPGIMSGCAGAIVAGLQCIGQTVACVELQDFIPFVAVGFRLTKSGGGSVFVSQPSSYSAAQSAIFIDGSAETSSGIAFDNTDPVALYLRNVYVGTTTSLAKTGATTLSGSGAWSRIDEYSANKMTGTYIAPGAATTSEVDLQHFELIDGVLSRTAIPVSVRTENSGAPPANIITRHLAGIPKLDSGPYISITAAPYNASPVAGVDNRAAIQSAIDAAATAGHNRVFIPRGTFEIGSPGIVLGANTKMFGTGINGDRSTIYTHDSWRPADGVTPPIVSTVNDASGTAFFGFINVRARNLETRKAHFNIMKWQVGRNSATACVHYDLDWTSSTLPAGTACSATPTFVLWITGNGGGRHYGYNTEMIGIGGLNSRGLKITDTTNEPLHVYGVNSECVKRTIENATTGYMLTNIEITNADNVRLYSMKREGTTATVIVTDSNNVAMYGSGGFQNFNLGINQVLGASNGILYVQNLIQQHSSSVPAGYTIYENVTGGGGVKSIAWPNGVNLYKRGTINDSSVTI